MISAPQQIELPQLSYDRWLNAKQVAGEFGLEEDSAWRWRQEGLIPEDFILRCGTRRLLFHPDIIGHLRRKFVELHE